jgi:hypothetical protein
MPVLAFAQGTTTQIRHGATLPAACSPANGDVFFKMGTGVGLYDCPSSNTWRILYLGATLDTDTSLTANSDTKVPSQKAVKTYVDAAVLASGSGTVTSVATTSPITGGTFTVSGTIACPTCAIGPGSSTANHLAKFSGTDGVTLADGGAIPAGTVTSIATSSPLGGGTITGTGTLTCSTCVVASSPGAGVAHFAGSTQTVTSSAVVGSDMTNNTVTSTQLAVVNTRRTCMMTVGDGANTVASGDYAPFKVNRCYIPYAATIVEVLLQSDAGTPSVQLQKRHGASTVTDLLSGALAAAGTTKTCAMSATSQTCIDGTTSSGSITVSTTSLAAGDYIEVKSGTASTETNMTIAVTFTVN